MDQWLNLVWGLFCYKILLKCIYSCLCVVYFYFHTKQTLSFCNRPIWPAKLMALYRKSLLASKSHVLQAWFSPYGPFGRWWNLVEGSWVIGGTPLKRILKPWHLSSFLLPGNHVVSSFAPPCGCCHDVLPHHRPKGNRVKEPWTKTSVM